MDTNTAHLDYRRSEIADILDAGPYPGDDFFRLQVRGNTVSHHLNVSADELAVLRDVLGEERDKRSLLPLQNGARVIKADVDFDSRGVGQGVVLAHTGHEFVTWRVYLHLHDVRWIAGDGDYLGTDSERARIKYEERRGNLLPTD